MKLHGHAGIGTLRAGELAFAPRNVPHTYANLSGAPVRALLVIPPGSSYFDRSAARMTGTQPPAEASKPIPEVTRLGPPLGAPAVDATGDGT